ncbi:MAG: hypothetical protein HC831_15760 [Chloroflexia bacterium]|nr:hypothetical protein [Chloroflexia bacterium]
MDKLDNYNCHWFSSDGFDVYGNTDITHTFDQSLSRTNVTLTVSYNTTDNSTYRNLDCSYRVDFNNNSGGSGLPGGSLGLKLELLQDVFNNNGIIATYSGNSSINSQDYSLIYYVNGVQGSINNGYLNVYNINTPDNLTISNVTEGYYEIQFCAVHNVNNTVEWSNVVVCYVKRSISLVQCIPDKCAMAEFYYQSVIIEKGENAVFHLYTGELNGGAGCGPISFGSYVQNWTYNLYGTSSHTPLNILNGQTLQFGLNEIELETSHLDKGVYIINNVMKPDNQCRNNIEAITSLRIVDELILDPAGNVPGLVRTTDETYDLDLNHEGESVQIEIEGVDYCNGNILVDGDWITIDKFTHQELSISCDNSETEHRKGRIVLTFPYSAAPVTININQSPAIQVIDTDEKLALAIQYAEEGSAVILEEGTYHLPIHLRGKNITLASKFLTTEDPYYIDHTIIDVEGNGSVIKIEGNGEFEGTTVIKGMHLTGGNAAQGGGVYCANANLELNHVLLYGNYADAGGGIYSNNSKIDGHHITLDKNDASIISDDYFSSLNKGAAIYESNESELYFRNSIIAGKHHPPGTIYFKPNSPNSTLAFGHFFTGFGDNCLPGQNSDECDPYIRRNGSGSVGWSMQIEDFHYMKSMKTLRMIIIGLIENTHVQMQEVMGEILGLYILGYLI